MTTVNLEMVSGDGVVIEITILDQTTGDPVNLAGCTASFVVARENSKRLLVTKTTSAGVTFPDPVNGRIDVELLSADTAARSGVYEYELQVVDPAGNRSTPLLGELTIARDLIEA